MITGPDGKEVVWSQVDLKRATAQERLFFGSAVRELRLAQDLTQQELAFAANVSARTVRNIERGLVAGQADVLERIFRALDIELQGAGIKATTQQWLAVIGPLLDILSPDEQAAVVQRLLPILTDAVQQSGRDARAAVEE